MPSRVPLAAADPPVPLERADATTLRYAPPSHRFRFLMSDGMTIDVLGPRDDSALRAALLAHLGRGDHAWIVGVADLGVDLERR
jgi:hypothetical protein